jgi:hypothetical protein
MAKNNNENKQKENYLEKRTKANGDQEYVVHGSPSKTVWGKIVVALIVAGTVLLPLAGLIYALIHG